MNIFYRDGLGYFLILSGESNCHRLPSPLLKRSRPASPFQPSRGLTLQSILLVHLNTASSFSCTPSSSHLAQGSNPHPANHAQIAAQLTFYSLHPNDSSHAGPQQDALRRRPHCRRCDQRTTNPTDLNESTESQTQQSQVWPRKCSGHLAAGGHLSWGIRRRDCHWRIAQEEAWL